MIARSSMEGDGRPKPFDDQRQEENGRLRTIPEENGDQKMADTGGSDGWDWWCAKWDRRSSLGQPAPSSGPVSVAKRLASTRCQARHERRDARGGKTSMWQPLAAVCICADQECFFFPRQPPHPLLWLPLFDFCRLGVIREGKSVVVGVTRRSAGRTTPADQLCWIHMLLFSRKWKWRGNTTSGACPLRGAGDRCCDVVCTCTKDAGR